MTRKSYPPIFRATNMLLAGVFLLLLQSALPSAAAQEPQPPPPPPADAPEPQPQSPPVATQEPPQPVPVTTQYLLPPLPLVKPKVWTIDDLESSRSPMEQYLLDKEASEAAAAAQAAADALASQKVALSIKMPATAEETLHEIDDTLQDINDQNDATDRLNKELQSVPEEQKAGVQREIDRHTVGAQTSRQELKALRDHLKQLNGKSPAENAADSSKTPPR